MHLKKSLFIDCVNLIRRLRVHLETNGCSVDIAESGREALTKIMAQQYDLILMESRLSDMECTELLERTQKVTPHAITIIVTTYPNLENVITALNLGVDAYFLLPFEYEQLLTIIDKKLKERGDVGTIDQEKITEMINMRIRMLSQQ